MSRSVFQLLDFNLLSKSVFFSAQNII